MRPNPDCRPQDPSLNTQVVFGAGTWPETGKPVDGVCRGPKALFHGFQTSLRCFEGSQERGNLRRPSLPPKGAKRHGHPPHRTLILGLPWLRIRTSSSLVAPDCRGTRETFDSGPIRATSGFGPSVSVLGRDENHIINTGIEPVLPVPGWNSIEGLSRFPTASRALVPVPI